MVALITHNCLLLSESALKLIAQNKARRTHGEDARVLDLGNFR